MASPTKARKGRKFAPLPTVATAEGRLPWRLAFSARLGRHAVAVHDLPAGSLILTERPVVAIPRSKLAGHVCHACFRPLASPVANKDGFNPCLPRYCAACKSGPGSEELLALDSKLAPLRIRLQDIAKDHPVERELLHLLALLDVKRATGAAGTLGTPLQPDGPPLLACSIADADALPSAWAQKPDAWRKAVTGALRPLHKALKELEQGGALAGYTAGRLEQLQSDAAMLVCNLQGVGAEGATQDCGVALFPAAASLGHSCRPNCHALTMGQTMFVRTTIDVPAGAQLTVCHAPPFDPRSARQAALLSERGLKCACERCSEPLATSTDRYLEGVWCLACERDVLVAVPPGTPEAEAAAARFEEQLAAQEAALAAASRRKKAGKRAAAAQGAAAPDGAAAEASGAAAEANGAPAAKANGAPAAEANGAPAAVQPEQQAAPTAEAPPASSAVRFWRCCSEACGHVEPAHTVDESGPGDVVAQADKAWQNGAMMYQMKVPQLVPQAESLLLSLAQGLDGRLHPYHSRVIDSLAPLINLALRRGDACAVFTHSANLWEAENAVQGRYSLHQLQYLNAIIDTSSAKATQAQSPAVRRQFEKKIWMARKTALTIRKVLLGSS